MKYKNENKIHPFVREKVGIIVSNAKNISDVTKLIVFGSSVTDKCRPDSDIDLAVEYKNKSYDECWDPTPKTTKARISLRKRVGKNIDIIDKDNPGWKSLLDEINNNGVVVYE